MIIRVLPADRWHVQPEHQQHRDGSQPVEPHEVGGYAVAPPDELFLSPWATHRHPDFWPDPERYLTFFPKVLGFYGGGAFDHGTAYRTADFAASAMWLPPGVVHKVPIGPTKVWLLLRLLMVSGKGVIKRVEQAQAVMARHHPDRPHYYLQSIGVRQDSQGLGLGSALLKHTTALCDRNQMPAYLESSSPRNVPLYERHGFEVTGEEAIGDGGPPLSFMWREPRQ